MPRKKRKKLSSVSKNLLVGRQGKTQKNIKQATQKLQIQKRRLFKWGESYTSFLLGVVVVIIGILFVGSLIKTRHIQQTSSTSTVATPTTSPTQKTTEEKTYTVVLGDNLWNIAEKFYNNGYKWVEIAKANNLQNPGSIDVNQKLVIPSIMSVSPTSQLGAIISPQPEDGRPMAETQAIKTDTYTVVRGDNLWDIAVRAYGDGYKWADISRANNLANPDIIHSGNVFKIPR